MVSVKALLLFLLPLAVPVWGVVPVDPEEPKLFREQGKVVNKPLNTLKTIPVKIAPGLYRSWIDPVKSLRKPGAQALKMAVLSPNVSHPVLNPSFSKANEWKPGKVIRLYEKSKDFDKVLNPLSLRDFNRFIYQRNPSFP
jgi:hypothetical protein